MWLQICPWGGLLQPSSWHWNLCLVSSGVVPAPHAFLHHDSMTHPSLASDEAWLVIDASCRILLTKECQLSVLHDERCASDRPVDASAADA